VQIDASGGDLTVLHRWCRILAAAAGDRSLMAIVDLPNLRVDWLPAGGGGEAANG
jgi:hypothetical protein